MAGRSETLLTSGPLGNTRATPGSCCHGHLDPGPKKVDEGAGDVDDRRPLRGGVSSCAPSCQVVEDDGDRAAVTKPAPLAAADTPRRSATYVGRLKVPETAQVVESTRCRQRRGSSRRLARPGRGTSRRAVGPGCSKTRGLGGSNFSVASPQSDWRSAPIRRTRRNAPTGSPTAFRTEEWPTPGPTRPPEGDPTPDSATETEMIGGSRALLGPKCVPHRRPLGSGLRRGPTRLQAR